MRVLIDTNILLDFLQRREPFYGDAEYILKECIEGNIEGYLTSHMLTDLFYILRKDFNVDERKRLLLMLCRRFHIIAEDKASMIAVLSGTGWDDLEDGLQMLCASLRKLDFIITRNIKDFRNSVVPAIMPDQFIIRYKNPSRL